MYAILYVLLYICNRGELPFGRITTNSVIKYKMETTPEQLCKDAQFLLPFAKAVYKLGFDEKPNYNQLKFMFQKNLMDKDLVPDKEYDWERIIAQPDSGRIHILSNAQISECSIEINSQDLDETDQQLPSTREFQHKEPIFKIQN